MAGRGVEKFPSHPARSNNMPLNILSGKEKFKIAVRFSLASLIAAPIGIIAMNFVSTEESTLFVAFIPSIVVAVAQWLLALRPIIGWQWLPVSIIGRVGYLLIWFEYWFFYLRPLHMYGVPYDLAVRPVTFEPDFIAMMLGFAALGGLIFGVCQWIVLRRAFAGMLMWIIATVVGSVIAWSLKLIQAWLGFPDSMELVTFILNTHSIPALCQAIALLMGMRMQAGVTRERVNLR